MYDYLVIGKGLIASAAARYLTHEVNAAVSAEMSGGINKVALIGPDEPAHQDDWASHDGVFASHYDQGRITRVLDADLDTWGTLAKKSIDVYGWLEQTT